MDVLVLNYNDAETTTDFVHRMRAYESVRKLVVVDNRSTDDSYAQLQALQDEKVVVIQSEKNGGYGYGNNCGIRYLAEHGDGECILLANPDTIITEEVLLKMETFLLENQDYAMVAPFMCDANGNRKVNTAFQVEPLKKVMLSITTVLAKLTGGYLYKGILEKREGVMDVEALSGSLFMMNKRHMLDHGMYDENLFLYFEELVLGLKFKRSNLKAALLLDEEFIHNHSVSINKSYKSVRKKKKLLQTSREYVLKTYYDASGFLIFISKILAKIDVVEEYLINFLKGKSRRK